MKYQNKIGFMSVLPMLMLAVFASSANAGQLVGDTTEKMGAKQIINELKKGGYVIYFRHGITGKKGEKKVTEADMANCKIQRNLSPEGVAQTKVIGKAFRKNAIPVGDVYASPYCRTMDTAKNVFGKASRSDALFFGIHLPKEKRKDVTADLIKMLGTTPTKGKNTGLVSHTSNLKEAVKIWPKPEGVAHVFKPESNGNFSYVGKVLPEEWAK